VQLKSLELTPLHVELNEPFGIATGAHHAVDNVLVVLQLSDGTVGRGEAAPVPHISGESQARVLDAEAEISRGLGSLDLGQYRKVSGVLAEILGHIPSARAGVEMAVFDALTRRANLSLWKFFGGAVPTLHTDLTIPTGDVPHAARSAARAQAAGFKELKIKVGGTNLELDVERVLAVAQSAPAATLLLDGNTAYSANQACELIENLNAVRERIVLFEQPVAHDDLEGLREVESKTKISVAADESLRSREDLRRIVQLGGISAINIKTAKFGVVEAWDLLIAAQTAGLEVMIGGMVETELSMTVSACLAAGVGGVRYVDLDTPLFLADTPFQGGFQQDGPRLDLRPIASGHGVEPRAR
jgi:L-Ala-D/L-Glu epimerase